VESVVLAVRETLAARARAGLVSTRTVKSRELQGASRRRRARSPLGSSAERDERHALATSDGPAGRARETGFDVFLADLLGEFFNLPADQVDRAIELYQDRICTLLDLDRCALWQFLDWEPDALRLTHIFERSGERRVLRDAGRDRLSDSTWISGAAEPAPVLLRSDAKAYFPWVSRKLKNGETVTFARLEELPAEAARDREVFTAYSSRSVVVVPLVANRAVFGGMSFVTTRAHREWSESDVGRFKLVAQVFGGALTRRRAEEALLESEERLRLAADAAQVGMWMLDPATDRFWVSDGARALFGYDPDAEITLARFLESVHVEDRERVREAVRRARKAHEEIDVEYRIERADGDERWIHSRGRVRPESHASPFHLLGTSIDVTDRKQREEALADQLRFESLLADLSARFINLPADEIDGALDEALRQVCDCLGFEMSALWQPSPETPGSHTLTHLYRPLGGPPAPDRMDSREHFPWCLDELTAGRTINLVSIEDVPPEAARDREAWRHYGVRSALTIPVVGGVREEPVGFLNFNTVNAERSLPDQLVQRVRLVAEVFANALERKRSEERLRASLLEIKRLQARLELENQYLRMEHRLLQGRGRVIGESPAITGVLSLVEHVAPTRSTVLIEGETGVGKELVAQRIHELSPRSGRPMVKVNCAALPSTLVESELFGREKGAYTGAVSREAGRFEVANGSTIFLDEVAELPLELQAKLLRVLEEGQFERVGSSRTLATDVRVIAATNRDLESEVAAGRFRRDLFYRLAVFPIRVPPLRDRREDVPLLVWAAVEEFGAAMHKSIESIPRPDMERLQGYDWPGNVRELRNAVERAMILCSESVLRFDLGRQAAPAAGAGVPLGEAHMSLDEAQRRQIAKALEASGGRVSGPGGAAERLGLRPTTLRSKMKRLRIDPRRPRDGRSSS
jgi:PAS domain S-box-containing protein